MGLHLRLVAVVISRQHSMAFILLFEFSVSGSTLFWILTTKSIDSKLKTFRSFSHNFQPMVCAKALIDGPHLKTNCLEMARQEDDMDDCSERENVDSVGDDFLVIDMRPHVYFLSSVHRLLTESTLLCT